MSGKIPAVQKNNRADNHAESAGAVTLMSARRGSGRRRAIQKEITRASRVTVIVPAAGTYSRTAVKTKASEIDMETCVPGSLTDADPIIRVRPASSNHSDPIGARSSAKM